VQNLKKIVEILFKITDKATKPLKETSKEIKKTGKQSKKTGSMMQRLEESLGDTGKSAKKAGKGVKKFGDETKKADKKSKGFIKTLKSLKKRFVAAKNAWLTFAAVATVAVLYPLKQYADFQDKMAMVKAVSRATANEFKALKDVAKDMGRRTRYSAVEAAEGLLYLTKAGIKANDAVKALPSVLQLAQAGAVDLGEAADISTNIMSAYGKTVEELTAVNDVLVRTFTSTNSTLNEIGQGFKYVGPIAKGLGADFNDLMASIGLLHNAGLKAEMSGTILRNSLNALFNPTKDEAKLMQELSLRIGGAGLQIRKSNGNFVGFASIIGQLEKSGLKAEEALRLFGMRAGPGIAALLQQGSEELSSFVTELDNAGGAAKDTAEMMDDTLTKAWKAAQSAVNGLAITLGKKLAPTVEIVLQAFAFGINKVTDALSFLTVETLDNVRKMKIRLQTAGTGFTTQQLADAKKRFAVQVDLIQGIKKISKEEQEYIRNVIPLYKEQSAELDKVTKAELARLDIKKAMGTVNDKQHAEQSVAIGLAKYEKQAAMAEKYYADIKKYYTSDTDEYKSAAKAQEKTTDQLLSARLSATKKWADFHRKSLDESLNQEKKLAAEIESINKTKADLLISTEDKLFDIKQRGRSETEKEVATTKKAYRELRAARKAFAKGDLEASKKSAERASDLFFGLKDSAKAYKGVQSAAKLTGKAIDEEGKRAQKALDLQRKSSEALRTSLESVNKSILQLTVGLQKALGIDSSAAEASLLKLGDASEDMAKKQEQSKKSLEEIRDVVKAVPLDGFKIEADVKGISETERLSSAIDGLHDKTVTVTTKHVTTGSKAAGYSEGGKLPGYGGGDQHPALLESGEWVINKDAVSKYGSSFFDSLNSMRLPNTPIRMASGGPVSSSTGSSSSVNVNLNLPTNGRPVAAQMSSPDASELINQLKTLDRLSS
jgi:TP901 family phage tail tape measure protein